MFWSPGTREIWPCHESYEAGRLWGAVAFCGLRNRTVRFEVSFSGRCRDGLRAERVSAAVRFGSLCFERSGRDRLTG